MAGNRVGNNDANIGEINVAMDANVQFVADPATIDKSIEALKQEVDKKVKETNSRIKAAVTSGKVPSNIDNQLEAEIKKTDVLTNALVNNTKDKISGFFDLATRVAQQDSTQISGTIINAALSNGFKELNTALAASFKGIVDINSKSAVDIVKDLKKLDLSTGSQVDIAQFNKTIRSNLNSVLKTINSQITAYDIEIDKSLRRAAQLAEDLKLPNPADVARGEAAEKKYGPEVKQITERVQASSARLKDINAKLNKETDKLMHKFNKIAVERATVADLVDIKTSDTFTEMTTDKIDGFVAKAKALLSGNDSERILAAIQADAELKALFKDKALKKFAQTLDKNDLEVLATTAKSKAKMDKVKTLLENAPTNATQASGTKANAKAVEGFIKSLLDLRADIEKLETDAEFQNAKRLEKREKALRKRLDSRLTQLKDLIASAQPVRNVPLMDENSVKEAARLREEYDDAITNAALNTQRRDNQIATRELVTQGSDGITTLLNRKIKEAITAEITGITNQLKTILNKNTSASDRKDAVSNLTQVLDTLDSKAQVIGDGVVIGLVNKLRRINNALLNAQANPKALFSLDSQISGFKSMLETLGKSAGTVGMEGKAELYGLFRGMISQAERSAGDINELIQSVMADNILRGSTAVDDVLKELNNNLSANTDSTATLGIIQDAAQKLRKVEGGLFKTVATQLDKVTRIVSKASQDLVVDANGLPKDNIQNAARTLKSFNSLDIEGATGGIADTVRDSVKASITAVIDQAKSIGDEQLVAIRKSITDELTNVLDFTAGASPADAVTQVVNQLDRLALKLRDATPELSKALLSTSRNLNKATTNVGFEDAISRFISSLRSLTGKATSELTAEYSTAINALRPQIAGKTISQIDPAQQAVVRGVIESILKPLKDAGPLDQVDYDKAKAAILELGIAADGAVQSLHKIDESAAYSLQGVRNGANSVYTELSAPKLIQLLQKLSTKFDIPISPDDYGTVTGIARVRKATESSGGSKPITAQLDNAVTSLGAGKLDEAIRFLNSNPSKFINGYVTVLSDVINVSSSITELSVPQLAAQLRRLEKIGASVKNRKSATDLKDANYANVDGLNSAVEKAVNDTRTAIQARLDSTVKTDLDALNGIVSKISRIDTTDTLSNISSANTDIKNEINKIVDNFANIDQGIQGILIDIVSKITATNFIAPADITRLIRITKQKTNTQFTDADGALTVANTVANRVQRVRTQGNARQARQQRANEVAGEEITAAKQLDSILQSSDFTTGTGIRSAINEIQNHTGNFYKSLLGDLTQLARDMDKLNDPLTNLDKINKIATRVKTLTDGIGKKLGATTNVSPSVITSLVETAERKLTTPINLAATKAEGKVSDTGTALRSIIEPILDTVKNADLDLPVGDLDTLVKNLGVSFRAATASVKTHDSALGSLFADFGRLVDGEQTKIPMNKIAEILKRLERVFGINLAGIEDKAKAIQAKQNPGSKPEENKKDTLTKVDAIIDTIASSPDPIAAINAGIEDINKLESKYTSGVIKHLEALRDAYDVTGIAGSTRAIKELAGRSKNFDTNRLNTSLKTADAAIYGGLVTKVESITALVENKLKGNVSTQSASLVGKLNYMVDRIGRFTATNDPAAVEGLREKLVKDLLDVARKAEPLDTGYADRAKNLANKIASGATIPFDGLNALLVQGTRITGAVFDPTGKVNKTFAALRENQKSNGVLDKTTADNYAKELDRLLNAFNSSGAFAPDDIRTLAQEIRTSTKNTYSRFTHSLESTAAELDYALSTNNIDQIARIARNLRNNILRAREQAGSSFSADPTLNNNAAKSAAAGLENILNGPVKSRLNTLGLEIERIFSGVLSGITYDPSKVAGEQLKDIGGKVEAAGVGLQAYSPDLAAKMLSLSESLNNYAGDRTDDFANRAKNMFELMAKSLQLTEAEVRTLVPTFVRATDAMRKYGTAVREDFKNKATLDQQIIQQRENARNKALREGLNAEPSIAALYPNGYDAPKIATYNARLVAASRANAELTRIQERDRLIAEEERRNPSVSLAPGTADRTAFLARANIAAQIKAAKDAGKFKVTTDADELNRLTDSSFKSSLQTGKRDGDYDEAEAIAKSLGLSGGLENLEKVAKSGLFQLSRKIKQFGYQVFQESFSNMSSLILFQLGKTFSEAFQEAKNISKLSKEVTATDLSSTGVIIRTKEVAETQRFLRSTIAGASFGFTDGSAAAIEYVRGLKELGISADTSGKKLIQLSNVARNGNRELSDILKLATDVDKLYGVTNTGVSTSLFNKAEKNDVSAEKVQKNFLELANNAEVRSSFSPDELEDAAIRLAIAGKDAGKSISEVLTDMRNLQEIELKKPTADLNNLFQVLRVGNTLGQVTEALFNNFLTNLSNSGLGTFVEGMVTGFQAVSGTLALAVSILAKLNQSSAKPIIETIGAVGGFVTAIALLRAGINAAAGGLTAFTARVGTAGITLGTTTTLTQALSRSMVVSLIPATTALTNALRFMAGPIGLLIAGVAAGVSAWDIYKDNTKQAKLANEEMAKSTKLLVTELEHLGELSGTSDVNEIINQLGRGEFDKKGKLIGANPDELKQKLLDLPADNKLISPEQRELLAGAGRSLAQAKEASQQIRSNLSELSGNFAGSSGPFAQMAQQMIVVKEAAIETATVLANIKPGDLSSKAAATAQLPLLQARVQAVVAEIAAAKAGVPLEGADDQIRSNINLDNINRTKTDLQTQNSVLEAFRGRLSSEYQVASSRYEALPIKTTENAKALYAAMNASTAQITETEQRITANNNSINQLEEQAYQERVALANIERDRAKSTIAIIKQGSGVLQTAQRDLVQAIIATGSFGDISVEGFIAAIQNDANLEAKATELALSTVATPTRVAPIAPLTPTTLELPSSLKPKANEANTAKTLDLSAYEAKIGDVLSNYGESYSYLVMSPEAKSIRKMLTDVTALMGATGGVTSAGDPSLQLAALQSVKNRIASTLGFIEASNKLVNEFEFIGITGDGIENARTKVEAAASVITPMFEEIQTLIDNPAFATDIESGKLLKGMEGAITKIAQTLVTSYKQTISQMVQLTNNLSQKNIDLKYKMEAKLAGASLRLIQDPIERQYQQDLLDGELELKRARDEFNKLQAQATIYEEYLNKLDAVMDPFVTALEDNTAAVSDFSVKLNAVYNPPKPSDKLPEGTGTVPNIGNGIGQGIAGASGSNIPKAVPAGSTNETDDTVLPAAGRLFGVGRLVPDLLSRIPNYGPRINPVDPDTRTPGNLFDRTSFYDKVNTKDKAGLRPPEESRLNPEEKVELARIKAELDAKLNEAVAKIKDLETKISDLESKIKQLEAARAFVETPEGKATLGEDRAARGATALDEEIARAKTDLASLKTLLTTAVDELKTTLSDTKTAIVDFLNITSAKELIAALKPTLTGLNTEVGKLDSAFASLKTTVTDLLDAMKLVEEAADPRASVEGAGTKSAYDQRTSVLETQLRKTIADLEGRLVAQLEKAATEIADLQSKYQALKAERAKIVAGTSSAGTDEGKIAIALELNDEELRKLQGAFSTVANLFKTGIAQVADALDGMATRLTTGGSANRITTLLAAIGTSIDDFSSKLPALSTNFENLTTSFTNFRTAVANAVTEAAKGLGAPGDNKASDALGKFNIEGLTTAITSAVTDGMKNVTINVDTTNTAGNAYTGRPASPSGGEATVRVTTVVDSSIVDVKPILEFGNPLKQVLNGAAIAEALRLESQTAAELTRLAQSYTTRLNGIANKGTAVASAIDNRIKAVNRQLALLEDNLTEANRLETELKADVARTAQLNANAERAGKERNKFLANAKMLFPKLTDDERMAMYNSAYKNKTNSTAFKDILDFDKKFTVNDAVVNLFRNTGIMESNPVAAKEAGKGTVYTKTANGTSVIRTTPKAAPASDQENAKIMAGIKKAYADGGARGVLQYLQQLSPKLAKDFFSVQGNVNAVKQLLAINPADTLAAGALGGVLNAYRVNVMSGEDQYLEPWQRAIMDSLAGITRDERGVPTKIPAFDSVTAEILSAGFVSVKVGEPVLDPPSSDGTKSVMKSFSPSADAYLKRENPEPTAPGSRPIDYMALRTPIAKQIALDNDLLNNPNGEGVRSFNRALQQKQNTINKFNLERKANGLPALPGVMDKPSGFSLVAAVSEGRDVIVTGKFKTGSAPVVFTSVAALDKSGNLIRNLVVGEYVRVSSENTALNLGIQIRTGSGYSPDTIAIRLDKLDRIPGTLRIAKFKITAVTAGNTKLTASTTTGDVSAIIKKLNPEIKASGSSSEPVLASSTGDRYTGPLGDKRVGDDGEVFSLDGKRLGNIYGSQSSGASITEEPSVEAPVDDFDQDIMNSVMSDLETQYVGAPVPTEYNGIDPATVPNLLANRNDGTVTDAGFSTSGNKRIFTKNYGGVDVSVKGDLAYLTVAMPEAALPKDEAALLNATGLTRYYNTQISFGNPQGTGGFYDGNQTVVPAVETGAAATGPLTNDTLNAKERARLQFALAEEENRQLFQAAAALSKTLEESYRVVERYQKVVNDIKATLESAIKSVLDLPKVYFAKQREQTQKINDMINDAAIIDVKRSSTKADIDEIKGKIAAAKSLEEYNAYVAQLAEAEGQLRSLNQEMAVWEVGMKNVKESGFNLREELDSIFISLSEGIGGVMSELSKDTLSSIIFNDKTKGIGNMFKERATIENATSLSRLKTPKLDKDGKAVIDALGREEMEALVPGDVIAQALQTNDWKAVDELVGENAQGKDYVAYLKSISESSKITAKGMLENVVQGAAAAVTQLAIQLAIQAALAIFRQAFSKRETDSSKYSAPTSFDSTKGTTNPDSSNVMPITINVNGATKNEVERTVNTGIDKGFNKLRLGF